MNEFGICASSGSACTSGSLQPSHVLRAMGVPFTMAHGSIRFSLSIYNTEEEIDFVIEKLPPIIERLRGMSPYWTSVQTGLRRAPEKGGNAMDDIRNMQNGSGRDPASPGGDPGHRRRNSPPPATARSCFDHVNAEPIPSREAVLAILRRISDILYPGYFVRARLDAVNVGYYLGQEVTALFDELSEQITLAIRHDCLRHDLVLHQLRGAGRAAGRRHSSAACRRCGRLLAKDIRAAYEGDPAARELRRDHLQLSGAVRRHRLPDRPSAP